MLRVLDMLSCSIEMWVVVAAGYHARPMEGAPCGNVRKVINSRMRGDTGDVVVSGSLLMLLVASRLIRHVVGVHDCRPFRQIAAEVRTMEATFYRSGPKSYIWDSRCTLISLGLQEERRLVGDADAESQGSRA